MKIIENYRFSEFFEENQRNIEFLVFHHIEAQDAQEAIDLLKKHQVSSHYLIDDKGQIFLLVNERDIAYHAGVSHFAGFEGLNANSIGIELLNKDVNNHKFNKAQLDSLIKLSQYLIEKYNIEPKHIVGHSDIAYFSQNCDEKFSDQIGCLDRKDDPSHMFDWRYMAQNGVGIFPQEEFIQKDEILFKIGDIGSEICEIKQKLANFGYKIDKIDENFDIEMKNLTRVFNRRFNPRQYLVNPDVWWESSSFLLDKISH